MQLLSQLKSTRASQYVSRPQAPGRPRVVIATASNRKFPEATCKANVSMEPDTEMQELVKRETKFDWMRKGEDWEKVLRERIQMITQIRS